MIQKVQLRRSNTLTKDNIKKMLVMARSTWEYAKFTICNGKYITVYFSKDRTVDFATNIRDVTLWNKMQVARSNYSINRVADFIFFVIESYNK